MLCVKMYAVFRSQMFVNMRCRIHSLYTLIQPFGSDVSSSLGKVYSRQATASVNCENYAVYFVIKYCPISTVVRNPASEQNLLTLSCCDNFSIRS